MTNSSTIALGLLLRRGIEIELGATSANVTVANTCWYEKTTALERTRDATDIGAFGDGGEVGTGDCCWGDGVFTVTVAAAAFSAKAAGAGTLGADKPRLKVAFCVTGKDAPAIARSTDNGGASVRVKFPAPGKDTPAIARSTDNGGKSVKLASRVGGKRAS